MSYHVLIVDDDPAICKLLSKVMISNEMDPLVVNSGAAALDLIARQSSTLDMILMDITLGDMEGFDVIQTIRRNGVTTPVIIISGRNEDYDFMYGLSLGADDYVVKPFAIAELYVKSVALVRRAKGTVIHRELVCGLICCDTSALTVTVDGAAIDMPRKELELLIYLMENRKRVVSRDELLVNIWGYDYDGRTRVVDDHIRKLRKALGKAAGQIKTVITKGYQIRDVQ